MDIHLNAKAGQTVEEFATELAYFAHRLPKHVWIGMFNGTEIETTPDSVPSELVRQYNRKRAGVTIARGEIA